jgi:hypothetical protein
MSDYERELLVCLVEECAEIQKDACKGLRFGLDDHHPELTETNRTLIARELGDLLCVLDLLVENGTLHPDEIDAGMQAKRLKLAQYLKHKPVV